MKIKKIIFLFLLVVLISGCASKVEETKQTVKEPVVESTRTVSLPSCSDKVKNQGETDIDCGGSCPKCKDDKLCSSNDDCINSCIDGVCGIEKTQDKKETVTEHIDNEENAVNMVKEKLTKGTRVVLSENYKKLNIGESYIFGLGVNNILTKPEDFNISITFNKAYDAFNNRIETDPFVMMDWINAKLKQFSLEPQENKIFAIEVEVKDVINEKSKTKKGTYVFDINVYGREGGLKINKEYDSRKQINIKVE